MSTFAKLFAREEIALRQRRAIRLLSQVFCWSTVLISPGFAQTLGEITGEVRDPTDLAIEGAIVTATHRATGTRRISTSNSAGVYGLPSLQPGLYQIKVEKDAFRAFVHSDIELHVQQTVRVDFHLQIGSVTETVEVEAGQSFIATENATVGTVIGSRPIAEFPLNGRNYLQLVALSPNVSSGFPNSHLTGSITRQGGSRVEQHISIAGQREAFTHFTLDGVENTDVNFNTYVVLPSIDALQEFKVQSGVYPAEFGRQTGQVNVSTKSGTNHFHGSLFEFLRNDKLDGKAYA
ncbi:MAG: carboxypeptidase regulatory-like domain-containing protein, partial [Bryobacteraceae bacterium]